MKALDIQINSLSNDHPSIGISYSDISKDYVGLTSWSNALEYGFKAIEQIKKSSQMDIETLLTCIDHIASIYCQRNKYEKALIYYKEALDLCLNYLPDDDILFIGRYYQIGKTYQKLEKYEEALEFHQKKLNIQLKTLPDDTKNIATTYSDISTSYLRLDRLDNALIAANQAHDQLLKSLPYDHPEVLEIQDTLDNIKRLKISQEARE
jgi:tetratricopeptide (TPR) repeat protein